MKKYVYILVILFGSLWHSFGQYINMEDKDALVISQIPKEEVYVFANSQLFFVGEYLYYSFNCLNAESLLPSEVSAIGYVEMIGEDKKVVFRQKVRLENGKGQGDFFIPVDLPSGNYKILGYTKWMLNFNSFFNDDISIINPYQSNQKAILSSVTHSPMNQSSSINNNPLRIDMDSNSFEKREKVSFTIKNNSDLKGNFALSVRSISPIKSHEGIRPVSLVEGLDRKDITKTKLLLPELRGELISGSVKAVHDSISIHNLKVSLSIPNGSGYIFKLAFTRPDGTFYFNLNKRYNTKKAVYQIVTANKDNFTIVLDPHPAPDYSSLNFKKFSITEDSKNQILNRSIHNQIENSYFNVKPDSVLTVQPTFTFNHEDILMYQLDDYTRFKTIKETFVEVIDHAWITRNNGKYVFQVRNVDRNLNPVTNMIVLEPLVMVDGILMQNRELLMDYDARKVKSIGIIRDKYVYGSEVFQGIIIFQTIDGDFNLLGDGKAVLNRELFTPLINKNYYQQHYSSDTKRRSDHMPDFRYQLLWDPNVEIDEREQTISFFTSDITGTFNISIAGFTDSGKPVFTNQQFMVH